MRNYPYGLGQLLLSKYSDPAGYADTFGLIEYACIYIYRESI